MSRPEGAGGRHGRRTAGGKQGGGAPKPPRPGLAARQAAVAIIDGVLLRGLTFDGAVEAAPGRGLEPRDRAFAHLLALTVLRRLGTIDAAIDRHLTSALPRDAGPTRSVLRSAAAQILLLDTPPHAAIDLAVDQCRLDRRSGRFARLANAVLRRLAERKAAGLDRDLPATADIPSWLLQRWRTAYGEERAAAIAAASLVPAALDLSAATDEALWAERLGAVALETGTLRLNGNPRVEELPGFESGAWWVQDAAAALPARLLGDVKGQAVADLCASPGGKTALLAAAGAQVTAVEVSPERADRLQANLARLRLAADVVVADARSFGGEGSFDAVLLDAPCSATGTIRRHPDILRLRRPSDIARLAELQWRLLDRAWRLVRPGGRLVYATCSLEPEEGERQIERLLGSGAPLEREPIAPGEAGVRSEWITAEGALRTLPSHTPGARETAARIQPGPVPPGMDGFYAARLRRTA